MFFFLVVSYGVAAHPSSVSRHWQRDRLCLQSVLSFPCSQATNACSVPVRSGIGCGSRSRLGSFLRYVDGVPRSPAKQGLVQERLFPLPRHTVQGRRGITDSTNSAHETGTALLEGLRCAMVLFSNLVLLFCILSARQDEDQPLKRGAATNGTDAHQPLLMQEQEIPMAG